jgi:next to BRCA1 gene 1 protein
VTLDSNNPSIYKQLYRAAKAKLKLRLKATILHHSQPIADLLDDKKVEETATAAIKTETKSYLDTVLSEPVPAGKPVSPVKSIKGISTRMPGAFSNGDSMMEPGRIMASAVKSLSHATLPGLEDFVLSNTFSIDCNHCGKFIPNEHYHCGICEKGDFDLCLQCVADGVTCDGNDGDNHWLVKRFIRNGNILSSITETRPSRSPEENEAAPKVATETTAPVYEDRTCNSCIVRKLALRYSCMSADKRRSELPACAFVTCKACPDFDLCIACFVRNEHGHNLAHEFGAAVPVHYEALDYQVKTLCKPGRGLLHAATCDGCNKVRGCPQSMC